MTTSFSNRQIQSYIPCIGDIRHKHFPAYQTTRVAAKLFNTAQLRLGEAYIRGMNISDSTLKNIFKTVMPHLFKYFPALLVPYEWVLEESQLVAEGSDDLMAVQIALFHSVSRLHRG